MRKLLVILCGMSILLGLAGIASAIPYSDTFNNPFADQWMTYGETVNWTFDLNDYGFNPDTQDIIQGNITLNFSDDFQWVYYSQWVQTGPGPGQGYYAYYSVDEDGNEYANTSNNYGDSYTWEVAGGNFVLSASALLLDGLSDSGIVNMSLTNTGGDFWFNWARIDAEGTEPVPEPATMLLLGSGLIGLAGFRRRLLTRQ